MKAYTVHDLSDPVRVVQSLPTAAANDYDKDYYLCNYGLTLPSKYVSVIIQSMFDDQAEARKV